MFKTPKNKIIEFFHPYEFPKYESIKDNFTKIKIKCRLCGYTESIRRSPHSFKEKHYISFTHRILKSIMMEHLFLKHASNEFQKEFEGLIGREGEDNRYSRLKDLLIRHLNSQYCLDYRIGKKVYCKDCKYFKKYWNGNYHFARLGYILHYRRDCFAPVSPYTENYDREQIQWLHKPKRYNGDNHCKHYKQKWWKFWLWFK